MTKLPVLTRPAPALSSALSLALLLLVPGAARAHDYPTVDRVLYVQDCLRAHPGPAFEMINKCSCAVDRIAEAVPHEEYLTMLTAFNALPYFERSVGLNSESVDALKLIDDAELLAERSAEEVSSADHERDLDPHLPRGLDLLREFGYDRGVKAHFTVSGESLAGEFNHYSFVQMAVAHRYAPIWKRMNFLMAILLLSASPFSFTTAEIFFPPSLMNS